MQMLTIDKAQIYVVLISFIQIILVIALSRPRDTQASHHSFDPTPNIC